MAYLKDTLVDGDCQVDNGLTFANGASIYYDTTTNKICFKIDGQVVATLDLINGFNIDKLEENKENE